MPPMPPPIGRPQQLPAQYFTTAAQLLDLTDSMGFSGLALDSEQND